MNFQFYLEKLLSSKNFREFKKNSPEAYFSSAFLSFDKESKNSKDQIHLDFFIPNTRKMFSFQIDGEIESVPVEHIPEVNPSKIPDNVDFDFNWVEQIIQEKMDAENIGKQIQKILLSLQNLEGKNYLIGTVFITGLGMIKVNLDLEEKEIVDFQKKSFFDMLKITKKDNSN